MDIYDLIRKAIKIIEPGILVYDNEIPEGVNEAIAIRSILNDVDNHCGEENHMLSILCKGETNSEKRLMFENIKTKLREQDFLTRNFAPVWKDETNKQYYEFTVYIN